MRRGKRGRRRLGGVEKVRGRERKREDRKRGRGKSKKEEIESGEDSERLGRKTQREEEKRRS